MSGVYIVEENTGYYRVQNIVCIVIMREGYILKEKDYEWEKNVFYFKLLEEEPFR